MVGAMWSQETGQPNSVKKMKLAQPNSSLAGRLVLLSKFLGASEGAGLEVAKRTQHRMGEVEVGDMWAKKTDA